MDLKHNKNSQAGFETAIFGFWLMMMSVAMTLLINFLSERKQNLTGGSPVHSRGVLQLQQELQAAHTRHNAGGFSKRSQEQVLIQKQNEKLKASQIVKGFSYDFGD